MKKIILHVVAVLVLLVVGAAIGYFVGNKMGFQKGLVADKSLVNPLEKATSTADSYKNPFKYQNPFDKIKVNPFDK